MLFPFAVVGASISVKWTGLASPGMVAVESFFAIWFLKKPAKFADLVVIAVLAMAQYHMWWAFHFWMLPNTGPEAGNMPIEYQVCKNKGETACCGILC